MVKWWAQHSSDINCSQVDLVHVTSVSRYVHQWPPRRLSLVFLALRQPCLSLTRCGEQLLCFLDDKHHFYQFYWSKTVRSRVRMVLASRDPVLNTENVLWIFRDSSLPGRLPVCLQPASLCLCKQRPRVDATTSQIIFQGHIHTAATASLAISPVALPEAKLNNLISTQKHTCCRWRVTAKCVCFSRTVQFRKKSKAFSTMASVPQ